jgi:hypothetical protein
MSCPKKAKLDEASIAWDHYRNFIDSQQDDNEEGDVDELVELLEILEPHVEKNLTDFDFIHKSCLLSILCSVAHYHLASFAITQTVDQETDDTSNDVTTQHLQASLDYFSQNAATWSMGANFARMTQRASPAQVCAWYQKAADCASTLRSRALSLLDDGSNEVHDEDVKEWIELLLLNGIVGSEYVCEEDEEEAQVESSDGDENDDDIEPKEDGYFSASSVEATSRCMAAMLLSTVGKQDQALQQLQRFQLTHRLHPNVWSNTTTISDSIPSKKSLLPCTFVQEALPAPLYDRLCKVLRPDASYWKESDYAHRGYYSYFFDIDQPTNLIEDVIVHHLLPRALQVLNDNDDTSKIVGAEWWPHTRPIQANLGHQLHFDTDEALLAQEGKITHPILSSVLYLTGGSSSSSKESSPAGATIVLDQTPESSQVAQVAWRSIPRNNTFMVFPGNLLHGVLPCPGSADDVTTTETARDTSSFKWDDSVTTSEKINHRLTFMVGFWTRRVPDKMKERRLYGPCGPLPPANDEHTWVKEIQNGYPEATADKSSVDKFETMPLPKVSPAWESIGTKETEDEQVDPPLEIPKAIDHRFFVQGAPQCFRDSLFHKD